jgi:hypothetical protein
MITLLYIILFILSINLVVFLFYILRSRAYIYYYFYDDDGKRYKLYFGYLKKTGLRKPHAIIDVNKPRSERKVGEVQVNEEGQAIVRLKVLNEYHEFQFTDQGFIDQQGRIFRKSGNQEICSVDIRGKRKWYELWLRCHLEVPQDEDMPVGAVIETGRFRKVRKNEITMLARAAAALLLYEDQIRPEYESASLPPGSWKNTAFVSSIIFGILYSSFYIIADYWTLFPFLGKTWSFVITMYLFYLLTWTLIRQIKIELLFSSDIIQDYLELLNRNTGQRKRNQVLIILLLIGLFISVFKTGAVFAPLFMALLTGLLVNNRYITAEPWTVISRFTMPSPVPDDTDDETGEDIREYQWELDSPLKHATGNLSLRFNKSDINDLRKKNPFLLDNQKARSNWELAVKELILANFDSPKIQQLISKIALMSRINSLSLFEFTQFLLDFMQSPNIAYALDDECDEIANISEYARFPVETLFDKRGDCDCKAVLAAALFISAGIPVLFLVNHNHAALAVSIPEEHFGYTPEGAAFITHKGKQYYYCETTGDGWIIGNIPDSYNIETFQYFNLSEL